MKLILENWNKFLVEQKAGDVLDDLLSKTHASGRKLPKGFHKITEDDSASAMEIVKQITPSVIREVISKYDSIEQIDVSKISDPREIAIINSLILFTAGNVATVRSPENFSDEDAKELQSPIMGHGHGSSSYVDSKRQDHKDDDRISQPYKDKIKRGTHLPPYLFKPTKELYTIANYVLIQCGAMTGFSRQKNKTIYRGLRIPEQIYDNLKVGSSFNNRMLSSWSGDKKVAEGYGTDQPPEDGKWCLFIIEKPQHGTDISSLSAYEHEEEYILGIPVVIKNIKTEDLSHWGYGVRTYYICEG
tara:strand:- start:80 stop:985 length:906 start_codon:yes stop_codon:yes gene_type:complete